MTLESSFSSPHLRVLCWYGRVRCSILPQLASNSATIEPIDSEPLLQRL